MNSQRSKLGGHWAGTGVEHAFYDSADHYYDRRSRHVRLGPVVSYFIDKDGNRIEGGEHHASYAKEASI